MKTVYDEICNYVKTLKIIDTHEHLPISNSRRNQGTDIFSEYCTYYFNRDLISSGMHREEVWQLFNKKLSISERWERVELYWERCRYTGYGQSLDLAVRELYQLERIDGTTIEAVNEKILQSLSGDHYSHVLKEKCNIVTSLLDTEESLSADREFFSPVVRIDPFIYFRTYGELLQLEKKYGRNITRIEHIKDACESAIHSAVRNGAAAFKTGLAYQRSLQYSKVSFSEAENDFNLALTSGCNLEREDRPCFPNVGFQNYMMHFALSVINDLGMTVQFHTGLQEGNGNLLRHSNPELLNPLFLEYPNVKFDIFHIGYPYQHVLGGLAKMFPNVYIDMCWAHIISPDACIRSLSEWLETMPYNKISGFGGDHCFVDGVAGHQLLARQNIAKALAQKVEEGLFDIKHACKIAKALLYDNPADMLGLEPKSIK